jgi:hypothetical protein
MHARPLCPKCGAPARVVLVERAAVRCKLEEDGTPGRVLSLRGGAREIGYECGGGHSWTMSDTAMKAQAARMILNVLRSPIALMSRPTREEALELAKRFEVTAADLVELAVGRARDT